MQQLETNDWRCLSREMGTVARLLLSLTLLVSFMLTCHADCCWDSDGYAIDGYEVFRRQKDPFWKPLLSANCDCLPDTACPCGEKEGVCCTAKSDFYYGCVIPGSGGTYGAGSCRMWESFANKMFCLDGTERVGSYCGVGKCNVFGCDCDGGCIQPGGKRRLLQAEAATSPAAAPDGASSDGPGLSVSNLVGQCQEKMVDKYKTTSLQDPEQIKAYFDCLDTDGSGLLSLQDATVKNASLEASDLKGMDSDGNGGIDPVEFDSDLPLLLTGFWSASTVEPSTPFLCQFQGFSQKKGDRDTIN
jgi:hypothetical protein